MLFTQKRECKTSLFIDKFTGITLRTNEYEYNRFIPKETYTAPTGRHHVKLVFVTGTHQHPLFTDNLNKIILYQSGFNCFHTFLSLIFFKDTKNIIYPYSSHRSRYRHCSNVSDQPYRYDRMRNYRLKKQRTNVSFL